MGQKYINKVEQLQKELQQLQKREIEVKKQIERIQRSCEHQYLHRGFVKRCINCGWMESTYY